MEHDNNRLDENGVAETSECPNDANPGAAHPQSSSSTSQLPDPPLTWTADNARDTPQIEHSENSDNGIESIPGRIVLHAQPQDAIEFSQCRKYITASQICAVVSLFIGGVLLSSVAVVLAILGYRRLSAFTSAHAQPTDTRNTVKRLGVIAIVMSVLALVINTVALILFYPLVMQAIQYGDLSGLLGTTKPSTAPSNPQAGTSLFG